MKRNERNSPFGGTWTVQKTAYTAPHKQAISLEHSVNVAQIEKASELKEIFK